MTRDETQSSSTKPAERRAWSRWLPAVLAGSALLLIGLLVWIIPAGRTVIAGTDRRNQADLAIAAAGLEQFSGAAGGIARANFIKGRVHQLTPADRDYADDWRYRTWQRHPMFDEFKITYAVTSDADCKNIARKITDKEGTLPFVANFYSADAAFLKIVSSFPLAEIRSEDQRPTGGNVGDAQAYLRKIVPTEQSAADTDVVCFAAGIAVDRLLVLDKAARAFSNLLIIDARGRVVAQVGTDRLPVKSLAALVPETSVLARTLAVSVGQTAPALVQGKLADSLKPVDLDIGGHTYVAYIRPLLPPDSFDACKPGPARRGSPQIVVAGVDRALTVGTAPAKTEDVRPIDMSAKPSECLVVALMPKTALWRQVFDLPVAALVGIGIAIIAGLALLPSLRLILLGPGEGIGRAEAIGVVLGLPAVVSMAILALLFAIDLGSHRRMAEREATAIAVRAAELAGRQLRTATMMVEAAAQAPTAQAFPGSSTSLTAMPLKTLLAGELPESESADPALAADPAPNEWPANFCRRWPASGLPVLDSIGMVDSDGRQVAGSRTVACRKYLGGRANVSARAYFQRLRFANPSAFDGTTAAGNSYVLTHIASLQDGVAKSIIAMKAGAVPGSAVQTALGRGDVYVVGTATLTTVIAPVLPPHLNLMVVDTRDATLPVLLHTTPGRSGSERLASMVRNPDDVRTALRGLHLQTAGDGSNSVPFETYYDGGERRFVAAPIDGSRWAAIASYSLAEIDAQSATTALHAIQSWATFSIVFTAIWVVWLAWRKDKGWPRLWPREAHRERYQALTPVIGAVALLGGFVVWSGAGVPAAALVLALVVRLTGAVIVHAELGRTERAAPAPGPLRPETQRHYRQMVIALIACLSVVPMLGFWREAQGDAAETYRRAALAEMTADGGALQSNQRIFDRLRWAYGIDLPKPPKPPKPPTRPAPSAPSAPSSLPPADEGAVAAMPGAYGIVFGGGAARPHGAIGADGGFSKFFDDIAGRVRLPAVADCPGPPRGDAGLRLCRTAANGDRYGVTLATPRAIDVDPLLVFTAIVLAAGFAALIQWLLKRVLRGLTGFGVPLEAFAPPLLYVGDLWTDADPGLDPLGRQVVRLSRKSLLVNAPYIILPMMRMGKVRLQTINVADPAPASTPMIEGMVTVVTGIELVLADRERRVRALVLLESQCAALARLPMTTKSRLVILSEAAPLERILDAFERDETRTTVDSDRENLRWSRLFEDFATFNFRQSRLTGSATLAASIETAATDAAGQIDPMQRAAITAVCDEVRWLPQRVAAGAIGKEVLLSDDVLKKATVPVDDEAYQTVFEAPVVEWAAERKFPGKAAVRSHLRNQCIEYYQKLWSSSTNAEHLVMHNLATSRFVNIGTALAFASLVRRGIVIFDPEPRLMNHSFAMFVRQAEKLDTIRGWQRELPRSAWVTARLPIFAIIGVMVAGLVGVVALSGEDMTALLPVLAAGIPALVAATQRLFAR